ncbi:MAG: shikimate dehydrogenase [Oscillospiraceae bacterium]|nr:shikimate dehydrogenase [Oscillospiraceae bacterium]
MKYGLIGEHLSHSYSCEIHALIADYDYELKELAPEEIDGFFREKSFTAINVTIPYKQTVIPYLDEISEEARSIGAVNTVVHRGERLLGYNTDFVGLLSLARKLGVPLTGKKVLILGSGGTSRTARAVAEKLGAGEILTVSRTARGGGITYEEAVSLHSDAQILINTTPVGMYPQVDGQAISLAPFTALEALLDVVYNPLRTDLVLEAEARGIPAAGGLYMLASQGVAASGYFRDVSIDPAVTDRVFRSVRNDKRSIVLIGMPSSGKSTVGALLARETGKPLFDTDAIITERIGMPIADYFALHGEAAFRELESEVIRELSATGGKIIATGGGAILREANVRALKRNGLVVFLDRSPEKLIATADRPLSSDREALMERYRERYGLYCAAADVRVDGDGTPETVAESVLQEAEA